MKRRFSEEPIIKILKEHEAGKKATDIVREHNSSEQTFYRRKSKYSGMDVSEVKHPKQLEEENRQLKEPVASLTHYQKNQQNKATPSAVAASTHRKAPNNTAVKAPSSLLNFCGQEFFSIGQCPVRSGFLLQ